jgi:hypothetical protein
MPINTLDMARMMQQLNFGAGGGTNPLVPTGQPAGMGAISPPQRTMAQGDFYNPQFPKHRVEPLPTGPMQPPQPRDLGDYPKDERKRAEVQQAAKNTLDPMAIFSNPLIGAGMGMLAGSMARPQQQAHINPWQAGLQGGLYSAALGLNQKEYQADKAYKEGKLAVDADKNITDAYYEERKDARAEAGEKRANLKANQWSEEIGDREYIYEPDGKGGKRLVGIESLGGDTTNIDMAGLGDMVKVPYVKERLNKLSAAENARWNIDQALAGLRSPAGDKAVGLEGVFRKYGGAIAYNLGKIIPEIAAWEESINPQDVKEVRSVLEGLQQNLTPILTQEASRFSEPERQDVQKQINAFNAASTLTGAVTSLERIDRQIDQYSKLAKSEIMVLSPDADLSAYGAKRTKTGTGGPETVTLEDGIEYHRDPNSPTGWSTK